MSGASIPWYDDFLGVAYRYFDLRMNAVPLFSDRKKATDLWNENVHWWGDHDIKMRFVETGDQYWFIVASETRRPDHNLGFFKLLPKSEHYTRFKKGHLGEAYLRFATYAPKEEKDVKGDAVCNCTHTKDDHDGKCRHESCNCIKFTTFELRLLKKKKTITDIKFLEEKDVKDDSVSWNCLYVNKYKNA
ncbi:hypothetical protein [Candidatus Nitrosotenuis cloacae]|uniref:Uncharacterized protein n=1 Tax=Candidatus Nitrosotenuis cloacae TaxID=1603555 RepID=A0A3G1B2P8_9ARCH|nr:hypothetical protein [Candidatus Nitrosotenuis cloacae]AJZ76391.1 hypothetical protein SU86_008525 [Candidatus Nitrosotenuis cloacae]